MPPAAATITLKTWEIPGILLEYYAYTPGMVEPLPAHAHPDYQFGFSFDCQGEYSYGGDRHPVPIGSLSVIHSGEVHAPSQRTALFTPATFWMMTVEPAVLQAAASDLAETPASAPVLPNACLTDAESIRRFLQLCRTLIQPADQLAQDMALMRFGALLMTRYAETPPLPATTAHHPAIAQVRDFLQAHYAQNLSLADLASRVGLTRFHLSRLFRQKTGLSLSAYQHQLRIAQAKKLLRQGIPLATIATAVGFYDQSHFGWHFKRLVGVTPHQYRIGYQAPHSPPAQYLPRPPGGNPLSLGSRTLKRS